MTKNTYGIYIGVNPESVKAVEKVIMRVVESSAADAVKISAFDALKNTLSADYATISNVNITTK